MATPSEKLAGSLEVLRDLQGHGVVAVRAADLKRLHRERLVKTGFLQEVMKGWYIPARPDEPAGESTTWYAAYWDFCAAYLKKRFGDDWSLSPEQSLLLHAGNWRVPGQLLVRSPKARNKVTDFPHGTSLLDVRSSMPNETEVRKGLNLFPLPAALIGASAKFFAQNTTDARVALAMVTDASDVLPQLLDGGHSTVAGRLGGAFRNIGRTRIADDIIETMRAAGYEMREADPFKSEAPVLAGPRERSPYINRIRLMWQEMRGIVEEHFPEAPEAPKNIRDYLKRVEDGYVTDAYHSLSIEGYRVSAELIERVRDRVWNPDHNEDDRDQLNALAAHGYHLAYQVVSGSVERVLGGENPGAVADEDHGSWYRALFAPSVTAGILRPADLAGYRNGPAYIRRSKHVPPSREAVRDLMPAYFDLLREEDSPAVRVVLGHFAFVYIHPYTDGNGRMGRFLMNVMLASAGYPWTVIPVERREAYMAALEDASTQQNIEPFTTFLGELVTEGLAGKPTAKRPER